MRIDLGVPDGRTFGQRLRELAAGLAPGAGLVVLGSGAIPLARRQDLADLLEAAASGERRALANSFYSADVVAIGDAANLAAVPDLPSDNALPRWLREQAGYRVDDLRRRWRLAIDLDSPLDAILVDRAPGLADGHVQLVRDRLARIREVISDGAAELIVAGRTSAAALRWLERRTASRTRVLVEERGLRAIGLAEGGGPRNRRPPHSVLGMLLDDRGPDDLGAILAELGDAAAVDSRVLLAHRLGADEATWPSAEDRFASDLLLAERIEDPWLRALTASARDAAIPILLGGHTLVGTRPAARGATPMTGPREQRSPDAEPVDDRDALTGWVEVGVRSVPELAPEPLPPSNPVLVERIADEIRRTGPMPFARFMHRALYELEEGYYESATAGPGRTGDFLTAPESHPIFGWTIARQLEDVWERLGRPDRFVVREHGAGTGALAAGILGGLRRSGSELLPAIRYQAIDVARPRLEGFADRLREAGFESHLEPPDGRPAPGAVVANELLDALPVHLVEGSAEGPMERFVALDATPTDPENPFAFVLGPPSTPALAARLAADGVELQPGQRAEICLELDAWLDRAADPLERGLVLLIDYGASATELYTKDRGSTLRAYHRHRVHADPLVAIGRQDLTAHVDLTAIQRAATGAGLSPLGRTRQAELLAALGIGDLLVGLQSNLGTTLEAYLEAKSAVVRMLDPRASGAFAVLAFGRDLPAEPPLRGFAARA